MGAKVKRKCSVCSVDYVADETRLRHGRQTCSRACSYELRAGARKEREQHKCGACGQEFERRPRKRKPRHGLVFCSRECAYKRRSRIVDKPYQIVSTRDRGEAMRKAWATRKRNAKPYPDGAREKARTQAVTRINKGFSRSAFERKAAEVFRAMGFPVVASIPIRGPRGQWAGVFDLALPARRLFIECHGDYWHGKRWLHETPDATQSRNLDRETVKHAAARALGFEVRILWEKSFRNDSCGACLAAVR